MTWHDAATLAARGLRRRPGRAVLTVLAVALAAALLTALLTIAQTAETRVLYELARGGPLSGIKVAAAEPDPAQVDQDDARPGDPRDLDDAALARIAALPDVRAVIPVVAARVFVTQPDQRPDGSPLDPFLETAVGVDLTRPALLPVAVIAGRLPAAGSLTEVAVTEGYLKRLGLDRVETPMVVGTELQWASGRAVAGDWDRVRGRWVRAQIVGVVAQEAGTGQLLVPIEQTLAARAWTAGGPDGGESLGLPSSTYSGLFVVAEGIDNVGTVRARITAIGYSTSAPENLLAAVRRYLRVVEIVLGAVGLIALAVAAIGITNALLAAVRERRREIGVLKAIGARDRDVLRVFLLEAAVLGLLGGALGTVAGWLTARAVGEVVNGYLAAQGIAAVQLGFPLGVFLLGISGSTLLATLGGTVPARRAARLPAREAVAAG